MYWSDQIVWILYVTENLFFMGSNGVAVIKTGIFDKASMYFQENIYNINMKYSITFTNNNMSFYTDILI